MRMYHSSQISTTWSGFLSKAQVLYISNCIRCHQQKQKCTKALGTHSPLTAWLFPEGYHLSCTLHSDNEWCSFSVYKQERRNRCYVTLAEGNAVGNQGRSMWTAMDAAKTMLVTVPTLTLESRQCHSPPQHGLKSRSSAQNTVLLAAVKWSDQKQSASPKRKGKS